MNNFGTTNYHFTLKRSVTSRKSNSIAWLANQLIGLRRNDAAIFDSIMVAIDRRILDQQIRDTIKQFAQVGANRAVGFYS